MTTVFLLMVLVLFIFVGSHSKPCCQFCGWPQSECQCKRS